MTSHHMPTLTPAEMLAVLTEMTADLPARWDDEAYDGATPDEAQMSGREMDRAADLYYGDAR
jgi:hypothetical protein